MPLCIDTGQSVSIKQTTDTYIYAPCGRKIQESLDVGEVVAEIRLATGLADIIRVQTRVVVRSGLHQVAVSVSSLAHGQVGGMLSHLDVAGTNHGLASREAGNHLGVLVLRDCKSKANRVNYARSHRNILPTGLDAIGVIHGHSRVILVLDQRISQAVADADTSQVDVKTLLMVVSLEDTRSHSRSVVTTYSSKMSNVHTLQLTKTRTVGLSKHKELVVGILRVSLKESLQK
jgi:hypothetical protein